MLPSPETRWFRSAIAALLLTAAIPGLLVFPSRHALTEVWPGRVEELILADGSSHFSPSGRGDAAPEVVARSHPHSLVTLELDDGGVVHGFVLAGKAHGEDEVLISDGRAEQRIDSSRILRAYPPNAMSPLDRAQLMRERFRDLRLETIPALRLRYEPADAGPPSVEGNDV